MPSSKRKEAGQEIGYPIFYGVKLDKTDPYLKHNFDRLEKRFSERYNASIGKKQQREKNGKPPHQTILKSIEDNHKRIKMLNLLRRILLNDATIVRL
jgi:hypothetical protein